eukprot:GHVS01042465.1.p1 GENE.GHVS01042465.1~~GHVS01042465.1.p1  ORF type:complete len:949 (+),score=103.84 GHVS01042465.1:171-3017(+)
MNWWNASTPAPDLKQETMLIAAVRRRIVEYAINQQLPPWIQRTPTMEKENKQEEEKPEKEQTEERQGNEQRREEGLELGGDGAFTEEWFCSCFQRMCQLSVCPPPEVVALLCHIYLARRTPQDGSASLSEFVAFLCLPLESSSSSPLSSTFFPHLFFICPFVSAVSLLSSRFSSLPHGSLQTLIRLLEQHVAHPSFQSWLCISDNTNSCGRCVLGNRHSCNGDDSIAESRVGCGVGNCCQPERVMHGLCDLLNNSLLSQSFNENVQIPFRLIYCITDIVHKADKWRAFMSFLFAFLFSSSVCYISELLSFLSVQRGGAGPNSVIADEGASGVCGSDLSGTCFRLCFYLNTLSDVLTLVGSITPLYYSDRSSCLPPLPPPLSSCASPTDLLPAFVRTFLQFISLFSSSSSPAPSSSCFQSTSSPHCIGPNSPDCSTFFPSFSSSSRPSSFVFDDASVRKCWALSHRVILQSLSLLLHRPSGDVSQVIGLISSVSSGESKLELIRLILHAATDGSRPPSLKKKTHLIVRLLSEMHRVLTTVEDSFSTLSPVVPQLGDVIGMHLNTSSQEQHKLVVRSLLHLCASHISRARSYGLSIISRMLLSGLKASVVVLPLLLAANNCRTYPPFSPPPCSISLLRRGLSPVHFFSNSHAAPSFRQCHLFHAISHLLYHPSVFALYVQFLNKHMKLFLDYCRGLMSTICSSSCLSSLPQSPSASVTSYLPRPSSSCSASSSSSHPPYSFGSPSNRAPTEDLVSIHHLTLLLRMCPPRTHSSMLPDGLIWEASDILLEYAHTLGSLNLGTSATSSLPNGGTRSRESTKVNMYLPRVDEYVCVVMVLSRWYCAVVAVVPTSPERKQLISKWLEEALRCTKLSRTFRCCYLELFSNAVLIAGALALQPLLSDLLALLTDTIAESHPYKALSILTQVSERLPPSFYFPSSEIQPLLFFFSLA